MRFTCLRSASQLGRRGRFKSCQWRWIVRTQSQSPSLYCLQACVPTRGIDRKTLFSLKIPSLPHSTHKCIFVTLPILFFFPWIISHVFCDGFNEGMMLHSCNISLILKDQGSTLPAQLLQPRFLYPPRTTELAQPPVGKGIFSCSLLIVSL